MKWTVLILVLLICSNVFAANDFVSDMSRLVLGDFLIYSGRNSEREQMLESGFNLPGFLPYNGEHLSNSVIGDNYHVFKTYFSISKDLADKNLTLYISRFDMPVIIRINGILIYRKGLRSDADGVYSTADLPAADVPVGDGLIEYGKENFLVIEVFPHHETSPLPELSIAEYKSNAAKIFFKNLFDIYLVLAAQFIALLVAVFYLYLFIFRGEYRELKYIIFSFLSFSFILAYANIGFSFDSDSYLALYIITRCFQTLSIALFFLFILESVELFLKQKKYIVIGIIILGIVCSVFLALQKDKDSVNQAFSVIANVYLTPLSLLCICLPVISIIKNKNLKSFPFLLTALVSITASLRDMMLLRSSVQPLFWFAPYAYLFIIIVIFGILLREMKKKELELINSRVEIMLSQIQPHFLYNSLSVIKYLCDTDPQKAKETVVEFSSYLRNNLDSLAQNKLIPFEKELSHTEIYLKIEKKRFDDFLTVVYDINAKDFKLPALTLQPVVENAVKHGISSRENGGTVAIYSDETENEYIVTVVDDGVGFNDIQLEFEKDRSHIGIENVRNRLASMCNGKMEIESKPDFGTTVVITVPKNKGGKL
ncbi:MAG: histidine kinase [Treponema sp.]|nr:histidine kinase [Treponema sp.]